MSKQVGGSHYSKYEIEPIDFINKNNLSYMQGNAIKYIVRYKDKNGLEDLEKAKHYIDMMIIEEYQQNSHQDVEYTGVSDEYVYEYMPFNELEVGDLFKTNNGTVMRIDRIDNIDRTVLANGFGYTLWYTLKGVLLGANEDDHLSYKGAK